MNDSLRQNRARLIAIGQRFAQHDFDRAPQPNPEPPPMQRFISLEQMKDASGQLLSEGDRAIVHMLLGACRCPATTTEPEGVRWSESCASRALQHFFHSGGHCFYFDSKGNAGEVSLDEILGSPLYEKFWATASSTGEPPSRTVFFTHYLPHFPHSYDPGFGNGSQTLTILREDWEKEMLRRQDSRATSRAIR